MDFLCIFCLVNDMHLYASVYMCLVITCWERAALLALVCSVCLFCFFTSRQLSFSYIGTGLPGLNQYSARINVSCSRTQRSGRWCLESSTLPLNHCALSALVCGV